MKNDPKKTLDDILKRHDATKKAAASAQIERERHTDKILQRFYGIRSSVIRPAMESVGEQLKSHGHRYDISEKDHDPTKHNDAYRLTDLRALIAFTVFIDSVQDRGAEQYPALTFFLDKEQVLVHERTMSPGRGGMAGTEAALTLDEVTTALVEKTVVTFLKKVFGGGF